MGPPVVAFSQRPRDGAVRPAGKAENRGGRERVRGNHPASEFGDEPHGRRRDPIVPAHLLQRVVAFLEGIPAVVIGQAGDADHALW